jgi:uncharacterized iron-regulated protein
MAAVAQRTAGESLITSRPSHLRKIAPAIAVAMTLAASLPPALAASSNVVHPLSGKIWDVRQQRFIPESELLTKLGATDFVLLGEVHDNPEHHAHQAAVLSSLVLRGRRPALAMEQFDREHQPAIDAALARGATTEGIALAGHLDRKGWQWKDYEPLVRIAVSARLPVVAANLSRGTGRAVAAVGFESLEPSPAVLALTSVWTTAREEVLVRTIVDGHCGQLSPENASPMTRAQRARDAIMADAMVGHRATGAVLIAGAGHVRRDTAVPLYLRARAPDASIVTVAMTEVQAGTDDPAAYKTSAAEGATEPVFDYLWFTPRFEREDPCAGFTLPSRAR